MQSSLFSNAGAATAVRVLQVSKKLREHAALGYATAFLSIGAASLLQWLIASQYAGAPFLLIYPAVIVSTLTGGLGPGFLAGLLAGISQWAFFIPDPHPLAIATYGFDATVCVLLIDFINRTFDLLLVSIDEEKQAKQHQYILAKELHHRIQNLFTVIQAIIRFSLPGDGVVREAAVKQRLMDRLLAMSATNQAITDSLDGGVRLADLIASEIKGFESRFVIGRVPALSLSPQMTQDFALILHELVINALKHGALSNPQGRVSLTLDWRPLALALTWEERDGPPVAPPQGAGFGSRILGAFAKSFCQNVETSYAPSGFRYALEIRSDQIKSVEPAEPPKLPAKGAARSDGMEFQQQMKLALHEARPPAVEVGEGPAI